MELEILKQAIIKSKSKADILKYFNLSINGRNHKKINELINDNNLDISHFDQGSSKRRKYEQIEKECPVCLKIFKTKKNKKEKLTCSYSCSNSYFRTGSDHANYKKFSDFKDDQLRGQHYSKKYRKFCFKYHIHKCVICDENKILDVHHYDEDKKNCTIENLIPICPTHHNYFHSKYRDEVENKISEYRLNFINNILTDEMKE